MRFARLSSLLLLWATSAHAGTVAILRPRPTVELTEALSRLHGELLSVGLDVKMIERPEPSVTARSDPHAWLDAIAADAGIDAVIAIVGESTPVAVDVWVVEKFPRRMAVSRVAVEPHTSNASEQLAIRAVEVLRSTFLEHDMAARARRAAPRAESTPATPPSPAPDQPKAPNDPKTEVGHGEQFVGMQAGAMALNGMRGVGTAILPMLRVDWAARSWFVMDVTLAGLGTRPTIATPLGDARVEQQFATIGGVYRFRPQRQWWPLVAVSAGVLHVSLDGRAMSPIVGHAVDQWSLLTELRFGMGLRFYKRYYSTLVLHVQAAAPYVAIHFVDEVVATSGRPNLALAFTLGAWL